jgi:WD40 repeat protein
MILKRVLGIVSLLIGAALCVWIIYNQFVPNDTYKTEFPSVFKLILPIACILVGWKWVGSKGKSDRTTLKSFPRRSIMIFGNLPFQGHRGKIESIAFSPDDRFVVTGGTERSYGPDRVARVWQIPSGRLLKKLKGHRTGVLSVAVSPDGTAVATGDDVVWKNENQLEGSCIRIWDARSGRETNRFGGELFRVEALAFSPDGQFLASGSSNYLPHAPASDGRCLRLWDWKAGREVRSLGEHTASVESISFSSDGKWVASGSNGMSASGGLYQVPTIRLFKTAKGREWTQLSSYLNGVNTVVFSRDDKRLLSGGGYELLWWDLASGTVKHQFDPGLRTLVCCAAVSPNGMWVAAGYGGQNEPGAPREDCCVRLFDAKSGAVVTRWEHEEPVHAIAFSHDSRCVLAGEERGVLRLRRTPL